jgi:hypothetical protein
MHFLQASLGFEEAAPSFSFAPDDRRRLNRVTETVLKAAFPNEERESANTIWQRIPVFLRLA